MTEVVAGNEAWRNDRCSYFRESSDGQQFGSTYQRAQRPRTRPSAGVNGPREAITKGEFVRVLADYEVSSMDIDIALYAVYPHCRHVAPKIRAFIVSPVTLFRRETCTPPMIAGQLAFRAPQRRNRLRSRSHTDYA
jgi:hypothetical protein